MKLPLRYEEAVLDRTLLGLNLSNELEGFEPIIDFEHNSDRFGN